MNARPMLPSVSVCRAACGRRCGRTIFALQNTAESGTRHQNREHPNDCGRHQKRVSTVSTVQNNLSTVKVWTLLFNDDNDLRVFLLFVHTVCTFLNRYPDESTIKTPQKRCYTCQKLPQNHAITPAVACWCVTVPAVAANTNAKPGQNHRQRPNVSQAGDCKPCGPPCFQVTRYASSVNGLDVSRSPRNATISSHWLKVARTMPATCRGCAMPAMRQRAWLNHSEADSGRGGVLVDVLPLLETDRPP